MSTTNKSPKILFLDIDGPMIPYRNMCLPGQTKVMTLFDPVAVSLINYLCETEGWEIVLHSSWVKIEGGEFTLKHCIEQGLREEYFHDDPYVTEALSWRYDRVAEWLIRHPEVTTYVMVDDDLYAPSKDGFKHPEGMASKLVLVNYYDGFLFSTFNEIKEKGHAQDVGRC